MALRKVAESRSGGVRSGLTPGWKYRSHRLTHSAWSATQACASGAETSRPWFSMKRTDGKAAMGLFIGLSTPT